MKRMTYVLFSVAGVALAGAALADDPSQARIEALEKKVAEMEATQAHDTRDVAAVIDAVLRDSQRRSQLLATAGDASAGYNNGFFIRSGDFSLKPFATFQFRNITDLRDNAGGGDDEETENGFEVRRLQFGFAGTLFTKDLEYVIQWNTAQEGGGVFLEDVWVKYSFADDWGVKAGQYKNQVSREKILADARILTVERSLLDTALAGGFLDRVQGVNLIYGGRANNNPINIEAGMHDGGNSDNTNFVGHAPATAPAIGDVGAPASHNFDFGLAGRFEWLAMGGWSAYSDYTAKGTKEDMLVLGLGGDWSQGGDGNALVGTADAQYETATGFTIAGVVTARYRDDSIAADADSHTDWGFGLHAAYLINGNWEAFGRYDNIFYDNQIASAGGEDAFHEITVGVNYYMFKDGEAGHRAKVTVDLNWLPNGSPGTFLGNGYIGDSGGEDELSLRAQLQVQL